MAKLSISKIKAQESGYANVPGDHGGETYFGISRIFWPHWKGWPIVDAHKPLARGQFINDAELDKLVVDFYAVNFFDKIHGSAINDNDSANEILAMAVNGSVKAAVKLAQQVLGLPATGILNAATLDAINNKNDLAV